jgi:hypothetical protein
MIYIWSLNRPRSRKRWKFTMVIERSWNVTKKSGRRISQVWKVGHVFFFVLSERILVMLYNFLSPFGIGFKCRRRNAAVGPTLAWGFLHVFWPAWHLALLSYYTYLSTTDQSATQSQIKTQLSQIYTINEFISFSVNPDWQ